MLDAAAVIVLIFPTSSAFLKKIQHFLFTTLLVTSYGNDLEPLLRETAGDGLADAVGCADDYCCFGSGHGAGVLI